MTLYRLTEEEANELNEAMQGSQPFAEFNTEIGEWLHFDLNGHRPELFHPVVFSVTGLTYEAFLADRKTEADYRLRIYDYLDADGSEWLPPFDVDFEMALKKPPYKFHKVKQVSQGEYQEAVFYAEDTPTADGDVEFSKPVVHVRRQYIRDAGGYALMRIKTISWYRADGEEHTSTKIMRMYYTTETSIEEGEKRRKSVIRKLKKLTVGALMEASAEALPLDAAARLTLAQDFLRDYRIDVDEFIEASDPKIYHNILADVGRPWLSIEMAPGITIRNLLLTELNIWGL